MKISLVRSGGVAGMRREATVDTSALDPASAREFQRLVEAADLARIAGPTISAGGEPDRFRYTLTVEDGARRRSVTFEEHRMPEPLRPLVEAVWRGADSAPGIQRV